MYFATSNKNKLVEIERLLGVPVEGVKLEIDEVQTLNPEECARKKAVAAYQEFGKPVLVEDTALFFYAWNGVSNGYGLPGVFIDYFMKTLHINGILKLMKDESDRRAYATTTLAISHNGKTAQTYSGKVEGSISSEMRGNSNFGWDPIFIPDGADKTFAEMTETEKDRYSMRRLAIEEYKKARG